MSSIVDGEANASDGPRARLIRKSAAWGTWAKEQRAARLREAFRYGTESIQGDEEADYSVALVLGKPQKKPKEPKVKAVKQPKPPKPVKIPKTSKSTSKNAPMSPLSAANEAARKAVLAAQAAGKSPASLTKAAREAAMKAASTAAGSIAATERKKQQQRAAIQQKQSQKQRQAAEDKESAFLRAIQEKLLTNPTLSTDEAGGAAANLNQEQSLPSMSAEVEVRQTNFFSEQAEELAQAHSFISSKLATY